MDKDVKRFRGRMGHSWGGPPPYVQEYLKRQARARAIREQYKAMLVAQDVEAAIRRERRKDVDAFARHFGRAD